MTRVTAKPTPGPTVDETLAGDFDIMTNGVRVGRFFQHGPISRKEAEANARAWVEGREAMEMIAKIKAAYQDKTLDDELFVIAVREILKLDEAKP